MHPVINRISNSSHLLKENSAAFYNPDHPSVVKIASKLKSLRIQLNLSAEQTREFLVNLTHLKKFVNQCNSDQNRLDENKLDDYLSSLSGFLDLVLNEKEKNKLKYVINQGISEQQLKNIKLLISMRNKNDFQNLILDYANNILNRTYQGKIEEMQQCLNLVNALLNYPKFISIIFPKEQDMSDKLEKLQGALNSSLRYFSWSKEHLRPDHLSYSSYKISSNHTPPPKSTKPFTSEFLSPDHPINQELKAARWKNILDLMNSGNEPDKPRYPGLGNGATNYSSTYDFKPIGAE